MPIDRDDDHVSGKLIDIGGPAITCVGEMPWVKGIAYGDEEGWLRFSTLDGKTISGIKFKVIESSRTINQIAFNRIHNFNYIAACTASNIAIHLVADNGDVIASKTIEAGGHGIYPTHWGGFLVPLGPNGLAAFYPADDGTIDQNILTHRRPVPYYYSMCGLGLFDGDKELWACAGRSGGILAITLDEKSVPQVLRSFQSVKKPKDYVSVWGVGNAEHPYAYVSLSRDRQVDFGTHLLEDRSPLTWQVPQMRGVAYSLFAADGSLFVLTSEGIYVGVGIVQLFLEGKLRPGFSKVRYLPVEAAEFTLLYDRWLMVLSHTSVVMLDVHELTTARKATASNISDEQEFIVTESEAEQMWTELVEDETLELSVA